MIRPFRELLSCGLLACALVVLHGNYGCTGGGSCKTDADCTGGGKCDTASGKCGANPNAPICTKDADCQALTPIKKDVCEASTGKRGTCFTECKADGDCGEGSTCDTAKRRCVCKQADCEKREGGGKYGCHAITNLCEVFCVSASPCQATEKCAGPEGKKHCTDSADIECSADADCKDATKAKCDTSTSKCVAGGECATDAECTKDPAKKKCKADTKTCVACLADADCTATPGAKCDVATGACQGPGNCTTSQACYDADKTSYCGDKAAPCKKAELSCPADNPASGNESWTEGIKTGQGSIIWNVQVKRLTDATSCLDLPAGDKCSSNADCGDKVCSKLGGKCIPKCSKDDDCEAGQKCNADWGDLAGTKGCVIGIANGTIELKFNYFHPGGKFKTGKDEPKNSIVKLFDTRGIATQVTTESGDKKEGVAQFSYCQKGGSGSYSFYVKDEGGAPSNSGCYNLQ